MYWSSVSQAMMTLFFSVTGGADWEPLATPIRKADPFFYSLFFFFIAFAALGVLNVLTGIFIDTAMKVVEKDEANVMDELMNRKELKAFRKYVADTLKGQNPGYITDAVLDAEDNTNVRKFMKVLEIELEDCRRVFKMMDTEKRGMVDLEEFIRGCFHAKGSVSGMDMIFLMSESKTLNKHLSACIEYLEERLDELNAALKPGSQSAAAKWRTRVNAPCSESVMARQKSAANL